MEIRYSIVYNPDGCGSDFWLTADFNLQSLTLDEANLFIENLQFISWVRTDAIYGIQGFVSETKELTQVMNKKRVNEVTPRMNKFSASRFNKIIDNYGMVDNTNVLHPIINKIILI